MQVAAGFLDDREKEGPLLCPAKQMGSQATALLTLPGFSGKVLAVLSTTVYLASSEGEILWISREGFPLHRRSILASFRPGAMSAGQDFFVRGPFLRISDEVTLDLGPATEWKPPDVGPEHGKPLAVVKARTRRLVEAVANFEIRKGLGQIIPLLPALAEGNKQAISNADPLVAKARDSIFDLAAACFNLDLSEVMRRGRELIGLGPGLTPSGDDFLGGLLFAAHALKTAYPQDFPWEEEPLIDLIDWASTQTHPISHTIFRDHAFGHGPEPLHETVASLFKGQDLGRTFEGAKRLIEIGDTSGWDILAGMLTGMLLVEGRLSRLPTHSLFETAS